MICWICDCLLSTSDLFQFWIKLISQVHPGSPRCYFWCFWRRQTRRQIYIWAAWIMAMAPLRSSTLATCFSIPYRIHEMVYLHEWVGKDIYHTWMTRVLYKTDFKLRWCHSEREANIMFLHVYCIYTYTFMTPVELCCLLHWYFFGLLQWISHSLDGCRVWMTVENWKCFDELSSTFHEWSVTQFKRRMIHLNFYLPINSENILDLRDTYMCFQK